MKRLFIIFAILFWLPLSYAIGASFGEAQQAFIKGNYKAALSIYETLAKEGHADSQFNLGLMHYFGQGAKQNDDEAFKWFSMAAEQGHADAQARLGHMYFYGQGVEQSNEEAERWWIKAAEQGNAAAESLLSTLREAIKKQEQSDTTEEVEQSTQAQEEDTETENIDLSIYSSLARQDDTESENIDLSIYSSLARQDDTEAQSDTTEEVEQATDKSVEEAEVSDGFAEADRVFESGDYKSSLFMFESLAGQGDSEAQYRLGEMYEKGLGVIRNYDEAVKWYHLAAENGNVNGQYRLSRGYYSGDKIVSQNLVRAYMWAGIIISNGKGELAEAAEKLLEKLEEGKTSEAIRKIQNSARDCSKSNYSNCDD